MSSGKVIVEVAKAAARNKAVRAIAVPVLTAAARKAGPAVGERYGHWRDTRRNRELAIKLARQLQGRYSVDTIIDGQPYFVVWKDGRPVQSFPPVHELWRRPELVHFDPALTYPPPPVTAKARGRGGPRAG